MFFVVEHKPRIEHKLLLSIEVRRHFPFVACFLMFIHSLCSLPDPYLLFVLSVFLCAAVYGGILPAHTSSPVRIDASDNQPHICLPYLITGAVPQTFCVETLRPNLPVQMICLLACLLSGNAR